MGTPIGLSIIAEQLPEIRLALRAEIRVLLQVELPRIDLQIQFNLALKIELQAKVDIFIEKFFKFGDKVKSFEDERLFSFGVVVNAITQADLNSFLDFSGPLFEAGKFAPKKDPNLFGGAKPSVPPTNEFDELVKEEGFLADNVIDMIERPGVRAALANQISLLNSQITAINQQIAAGFDVANGTVALSNAQAALANATNFKAKVDASTETMTDITNRKAFITSRKAQITSRVTQTNAFTASVYDERYAILDGGFNLSFGPAAMLKQLDRAIPILEQRRDALQALKAQFEGLGLT